MQKETQAQTQTNLQNVSPKKGLSACWIAGLVVFIVLVFIFGGYFGLAWLLRTINKEEGASESKQTQTEISDQQLIGEWESECLIPDANSPWSEQHHFTFKSDGTATHIRWSGYDQTCSKSQTITTNYTYTIPETDKINFTFVNENREPKEFEEMSAGIALAPTSGTMYDIYQISGDTLLFGHGFRDKYSYGDASMGDSADNRINTLNEYIRYKKK